MIQVLPDRSHLLMFHTFCYPLQSTISVFDLLGIQSTVCVLGSCLSHNVNMILVITHMFWKSAPISLKTPSENSHLILGEISQSYTGVQWNKLYTSKIQPHSGYRGNISTLKERRRKEKRIINTKKSWDPVRISNLVFCACCSEGQVFHSLVRLAHMAGQVVSTHGCLLGFVLVLVAFSVGVAHSCPSSLERLLCDIPSQLHY